MNPKGPFAGFPASEREELLRLAETAGELRPNERFVNETEMQLRAAFATRKDKPMKRFNLFWQFLAGAAAVTAFSLGIIWLVRSVAPEPKNPSALPGTATVASLPVISPEPQTTPVPSSTPELPTDTWNGMTVYRAVDFPDSPAEAPLRTYSADQHATLETAQQLAERFGIQGEVYLAPGYDGGANSFLVTDGKQRLYVTSARNFSYQSGINASVQGSPVSMQVAAAPIDAYLKSHGFDFAYRLEAMQDGLSDWFQVVALTEDGRSISFSEAQQSLRVQVDAQGQVINLDAYLLNVDPQPVGQFGIISAEEAWQKFIQADSVGRLEHTSLGFGGSQRLSWQRVYPENQAITLYGGVTSYAAAQPDKPPFLSIDVYTAIGKTDGLEKLSANTFVQAEGQFVNENGIQKFQVDAWQTFTAGPQSLEGSLRSEGGKMIISSQGTDYTLSDIPADVPVPVEKIYVSGVALGSQFEWQTITYYLNGTPFMGGGGGGVSFARLNLSGAPVPWPSPQPSATPESLVGKHVEAQQGNLTVTIYQKKDGSQRVEYVFSAPDGFYILQGQGLEQLQAYQNRPIVVWGTVTDYTPIQRSKAPVLTVGRYEVPFPNLKFQIIKGTQKMIKLKDQDAALFTTEDGKTYLQTQSDGGIPDASVIGAEGDQVLVQALLVPGETLGGYPAMRVFGVDLAINPQTGQPSNMEVSADQPYQIPEEVQGRTQPSSLTIESIELVYYTGDPRNAGSALETISPYLQPAWRFYGHYNDGSKEEILIQALKPEFLLPPGP